jgi:para-aminobenzoate synthetase component 2
MLANWLADCGTAPAEALVRQLEDEVANAVQAATTRSSA